jgi:hypothetical protein
LLFTTSDLERAFDADWPSTLQRAGRYGDIKRNEGDTMARSELVVYSYTCDVCGREIPEEDQADAHQTVTWGINKGSASYEIDLCRTDLAKLRRVETSLEPLLSAGHRVAGSGRRQRSAASSGRGRRKGRGSSADSPAIREWARENGYEVSDRGRISAGLREAYLAAR